MATLLCMGLMLFPVAGLSGKTDTSRLTVHILKLEAAKGKVHIALYDNEADFMKTEKRLTGLSIPVSSTDSLKVELGRFPFGIYAVAVFHDLNENGKLDRNALGIPTEPYAFSNNARVKWAPPNFQETSFELAQAELSLRIELKRWKDY